MGLRCKSDSRAKEKSYKDIIVVDKPEINKEHRPTCDDCGSSRVNSSGHRWICLDCGRHFVKNYRKKHVKIDIPCPYCGGKLKSKGPDCYCPSCDKWISKSKLKRIDKIVV